MYWQRAAGDEGQLSPHCGRSLNNRPQLNDSSLIRSIPPVLLHASEIGGLPFLSGD